MSFTKRKALAALAAATIASAGLVACSSSTEAPSADGASAVTLTVWSSQEDQTDSDAWLQTMQASFEENHPELDITWNNSVVSAADAATTVGQDPSAAADVYLFANDQLGELQSAGAVGQLSDSGVAQLEEQAEDSIANSVKGTDGEYYGMPYEPNTWFMYYDKSKLSEDDVKSFDTMLEKAKVSFPLSNAWYLASFYAGAGTTFFGPDGLDEDQGIQAGDKATAVTTYLTEVAKNPNFINDADGSGMGSLGRNVDVVFSGAWDAENAKEALGDNFAVASVPTFRLEGQDVQMKAFSGSKAVAYNPNTSNPQVAAMFAEFLASSESQKVHFEKDGVIPSDKSLSSDSTIASDPVAVALFETVSTGSILQPTFRSMSDFWDPAENFGKALVNGEVNAENAGEKTDSWFASYN